MRNFKQNGSRKWVETAVRIMFSAAGLIAVGCVVIITAYLLVSGLPAIGEIGWREFFLGRVWSAGEGQFGILPFILTTLCGTAGALLLGLPVALLTAVWLSKMAPPHLRAVLENAVNLLAAIPSVVYGLVGMLVIVPAIRQMFGVPDGSGLLAATVVLAVMIFPNIIKVAMTALDAVPCEFEQGSLALGASWTETVFRVSVPAAKSGIAAAVVLGVGRAVGETMAIMMVAGNVANMPAPFASVRFLTGAVAMEMSYSEVGSLHYQALFSIALVLYVFIMLLNMLLNVALKHDRG